MSYKKIEDIDYLYNNIQEELDESLKHSLGVLYEEMQDSGYSDSAITSYFETVDIFELNEKLELLSENPIKNPNNWKRAWDIIRARGSLVKRLVGNIIKRNTPVKTRINVKNNINSTKDKVSSTIQKGKDLIKNNPNVKKLLELSLKSILSILFGKYQTFCQPLSSFISKSFKGKFNLLLVIL